MEYVLITGVSTGIGYDLTELLIQKGYFVIGTVRKEADKKRLQASFPDNFTPLMLDVTKGEDFAKALPEVEKIVGDKGLTALINNAGIAIAGPMQHLKIDVLKNQFDVNVIGLVQTTQTFLPLLIGGEKPGRIINIGSVSGRVTLPFVGAYAASKHAVEAISDAMRRELFIHGIKVVLLQPGPAKSEIWNKAIDQKDEYLDTEYRPILKHMEKNIRNTFDKAVPLRRVTETVLKAMTHPNPKARYPISASRWMTILISKLPDKWADKLIIGNVKKYWEKK